MPAVAALSCACTISLVAAAHASTRGTPPVHTLPARQPATAVLNKDLAQLASLQNSRARSVAGVWVSNSSRTVHVNFTSGRDVASTRAAVNRLPFPGGWVVKEGRAPRSYEQLQELTTRMDHSLWGRLHAAEIDTVGIDAARDQVDVQVEHPKKVDALALSLLSAGGYRLERGTRLTTDVKRTRIPRAAQSSVTAAVTAPNRGNDLRPFKGGDPVISVQGQYDVQCQTGFSMTNGTVDYTSLDGHCGPNGTVWYNGNINALVEHAREGTASHRDFHNGGNVDAERVGSGGKDFQDRFWYGAKNSTTSIRVYDIARVVQGQKVCVDSYQQASFDCAAVTYASCKPKIRTDTGALVQLFGEICVYNTTRQLARSGDSGGPVSTQGPEFGAVGTIDAGGRNSLGFYNLIINNIHHVSSAIGGHVRYGH